MYIGKVHDNKFVIADEITKKIIIKLDIPESFILLKHPDYQNTIFNVYNFDRSFFDFLEFYKTLEKTHLEKNPHKKLIDLN